MHLYLLPIIDPLQPLQGIPSCTVGTGGTGGTGTAVGGIVDHGDLGRDPGQGIISLRGDPGIVPCVMLPRLSSSRLCDNVGVSSPVLSGGRISKSGRNIGSMKSSSGCMRYIS